MFTQRTATENFNLPFSVLTEIRDGVIVTDNDGHVVYWNGPAEDFYGLRAEEVLGRPLLSLCPELASQSRASDGKERDVAHRRGGAEIYLECSEVPLYDQHGVPAGTLWVQRDVTERKHLEMELAKCHALLRERNWSPHEPEDLGSSDRDVVLWAEDNDNDAILMARAWRQAQVEDQLVRVKDGAEVIEYLKGEGAYYDRQQHPLPRLLLLDIKMPQKSGMEVLEWLHAQPRFKDLPTVILTSSGASSDVREAARLGVKGYLIKPVNVTEWIAKVTTVTSQCR